MHVSNWDSNWDLVIYGQVDAFSSLVYKHTALSMTPEQRNLGHADYQDFMRAGNQLYVANDGGMFRYDRGQVAFAASSTSSLSSEESLNATFRTYQCVDVQVATSGDDFLTGIWHNRCVYKSGNTAEREASGDGFQCAFKPDDPNLFYTSAQNGHIYRGSPVNAGGTYLGNVDPLFNTRIFTDPANPAALYHIGLKEVFELADAATSGSSNPNWVSIFDISPASIWGTAVLDDVANSPVYLMEYDISPTIHKITSLSPANKTVLTNDFSNLSNGNVGYVRGMSIDPNNENRVFVATNFLRLFEVSIQGSTAVWNEINTPTNVPDMREITCSTEDPNHLLLGTVIGLYQSKDFGQSWTPVLDIPAVEIEDISVRPDGKVSIATYGRGVWMADFNSSCALDGIAGNIGVIKFGSTATFTAPINDPNYDYFWTAKKTGTKFGFVIGYGTPITETFPSFGTYQVCLTITDPNDPTCFKKICRNVTFGWIIQGPTKHQDILLPKTGDENSAGLSAMIEMHVYPNPASDFVNIELNESFDGVLLIHNIQGQMIREIAMNSENARVDLIDLLPGNYVLSLANKSGVLSQKQIVKD